MNTSKRTITPAYAARLLETSEKKNVTNRAISSTQVKVLESIILRGKWVCTHQGILLGKDERIIDGQHRLTAIRNAGVTVPMLVTVDETLTSPLDQPIDQGRRRSQDFVLGLERHEAKIARHIGRIILGRECALDETGLYARKLDPAMRELLDSGLKGRNGKFSASPILAAACIQLMLSPDESTYIKNTLKAFASLDPKQLQPKPYSLYRQITGLRGSMDSRQLFVRALKAFEADQQNEKKIQIKDEDVAWAQAVTLVKRALGVK